MSQGRHYYTVKLLLTSGGVVIFDENPQPTIAKAAALGRKLALKRPQMTHAAAAAAVVIRDGVGSAVHREELHP